jgi:hypothetical protein
MDTEFIECAGCYEPLCLCAARGSRLQLSSHPLCGLFVTISKPYLLASVTATVKG